ncbi:MAG: acyltransferase [Candidatus Hydrogenedentes bacterium]|nr:acyltransferase [Candidatus Hydrogenedentota bacterium]
MGLTEKWYSWRNVRQFRRRGIRNRFPFPKLHVDGHAEIGDMCRFRDGVILRTQGQGRIIMGSRSGFSWNCVADATELIQIGDRTGIAENVVIQDYTVELLGNTDRPGRARRVSKPVHIGNDVFIGSSCFIGPGVTIGDGAIIAHHSVVTRDVGSNEIWDGRPARRMAHRTEGVPDKVRAEVEALIAEQGVALDRNLGAYRTEGRGRRGFSLRVWMKAILKKVFR